MSSQCCPTGQVKIDVRLIDIDNITGTVLSSLDAIIHKGSITSLDSNIMMSVMRHMSSTLPDKAKFEEMMVDLTMKSRHGRSLDSWVQALELRSQQIQSNNPITLTQVTMHLQNDSKGVVNGLGLPPRMQRSTIEKLMPQR
jgi:hypothetical protein